MTRALSTILAGWLLVIDHGGTVAFYDTKEDCEVAAQSLRTWFYRCVPDRFAVEQMRQPQQEIKP